MTKIKPVRVGIDWRAEISLALKGIVIGVLVAMVVVIFEGRV